MEARVATPPSWPRPVPAKPAPPPPPAEPPVLRLVDGFTGKLLGEVPVDSTWNLRRIVAAAEELTEIPGPEIRLLWAGGSLGPSDVIDMMAGNQTVRVIRIQPEWREPLDKIGRRILTNAELEKIQEAVANGGDGGLQAVKEAQAGPREQDLSEVLMHDRQFLMAALVQDGAVMRFAPEELRGDREVALVAVRESGVALRFVTPELRADKEVVLTAAKSNGSALAFASEALQADREVVLAAVRENGEALRFAPEVLRRDPALALAAVEHCGAALRHAHFVLQTDPRFAREAVRMNGEALMYVSQELRRDKEIVLAAKAFWEAQAAGKTSNPLAVLKRAHKFLN